MLDAEIYFLCSEVQLRRKGAYISCSFTSISFVLSPRESNRVARALVSNAEGTLISDFIHAILSNDESLFSNR